MTKTHVQSKTNAREAHRPAPSSPSGGHNAKRNDETQGQRAQKDFET